MVGDPSVKRLDRLGAADWIIDTGEGGRRWRETDIPYKRMEVCGRMGRLYSITAYRERGMGHGYIGI